MSKLVSSLCLFVVVAMSTISFGLASDNTLATNVGGKEMSCFQCIKAGLGAKDNGCPQCIPSFLGIRDSSCKQWTEDRNANGEPSIKDVSWLFGFISGYNAYAPGTLKKPKAMFFSYDEPAILKEIDNQCAISPQSSVVIIVMKFLDSFRK